MCMKGSEGNLAPFCHLRPHRRVTMDTLPDEAQVDTIKMALKNSKGRKRPV